MVELSGKTLNVITVIEEPFVNNLELNVDYMERTGKGPGVVMELLREIGKQLNIQYNIQIRKDGKWGEFVNGSWDGMIGMLERKEVDLLAGALIVREDRATVIDYSAPFMISESGLLIKSPDTVENTESFLIITAPFDWPVWFVCLLTIFLSSFLLKLFSRPLVKKNVEEQLTWVETVWLFFSAFVQQEFKKLPKSFTTRTFLSFWYLVSLSLAGIFTGNMIALFAVSKQTLPFKDIKGLVDKMISDDYKIVLQNNTASRIKFLQNSELDVFKYLWHLMTVEGKWINVTSLDEGSNEVLKNYKNVFVGPKESIQSKSLSNCNLTTLDTYLDSLWFAIGFQKNSNYTKPFSEQIRLLVERGFVSKWVNDYLMETTIESHGRSCAASKDSTKASSNKPLDLIRAQGAFWIILIGCFSGSVAFISEILYAKFVTISNHRKVKPVKMVRETISCKKERKSKISCLKNILLKTKFRINTSITNVEHSVTNIQSKRLSIRSTTETLNCEINDLKENTWVKRIHS